MSSPALATLLLVGSILLLTWLATYGRTVLAKERYLLRMSALRDRVEDAVFAGDLPDADPVQYLWQKTHVLGRHPEVVSFANFAAFQFHPRISKVKLSQPSNNNLSPAERKRMNEFEREFVEILADYVVDGSRYWLVLRTVAAVQGARRVKSQRVKTSDPVQLSETFNKVLDNSSEKAPNGQRRVSPLLLTA